MRPTSARPTTPRDGSASPRRVRDSSPLPGALRLLDNARNREYEIKKRLVFLTRQLEKHYSGDVAKSIVLERNRRAGEMLREFKDKLFHRDLAREMQNEPRATADDIREISLLLNVAQRSVVPPWESPSWFKLFRHVDADGSGLISYAEFVDMVRDILRMSETEMPEPRLKALWLALDADCSGYLTSGEFGAFMKLGEPAVERISNLERRKGISAEQRLDLETRYAEDVTWEARKIERDLDAEHGPRSRTEALARRLRATPSYGADGGAGPRGGDAPLLDIDEWLEREYAKFHSAISAARPPQSDDEDQNATTGDEGYTDDEEEY